MGKKRRIHRWMILAGGLFILLLPSFLHVLQLRERRRELKAQIEQLQQENLKLKQEFQLLKGDSFYLERVARKKLGVAREGEILYRFEDSQTAPPR